MSTATLELATTAADEIDKLDTAKPLDVIFQPYQTILSKWESKAASLVVTDISQKTEMAQARLARLELKEARVAMDKTRKGLVENLKARTGKIDSTARIIREKIEELEASLLESEQFAERHAAKLKAESKTKRDAELAPWVDTPILGDLSDLSEEQYAKVLSDAKLLRQSKLDAIAKAEAERKAKEEADRIERERIAAENERLKAEAVAREAAAKAEREAAAKKLAEERAAAEAAAKAAADKAAKERAAVEAKARAEREAVEAKARAESEAAAKESARLKAELAAKEKAEAQARAEAKAKEEQRLKAEREAAAAPDKAKLKAFAAMVRGVAVPTLNNTAVQAAIAEQIELLAAWVEKQQSKL